MIYLLLKMFLFLLAAALLGFLLGRWWIRRQFNDVSEEYIELSRLKDRAAERLENIEDKIATLEPTDLTPFHARLGALEDAIKAIRFPDIPEPKDVDLQPIRDKLAAIEEAISKHQPSTPSVESAPELYEAPTRGEPDDLKRIAGVGKVLEKMLHEVGVYYFDQVASWDAQQVEYVNSKLTAFKGRIKRDNWVEQAKMLGSGPPGSEHHANNSSDTRASD